MDLHLENLTKRFGDRLALDIPDLTIHAGEFFTFVGPSGCGKSTLLNVIAGLEEPTTGTIRAGGRVLSDLAPQQRNLAFVFQSYALYPHRTVFDNIAFPLEIAGVRRDELRRRVGETASLLGIGPLVDKYPRQLSGGERQRVALGRAIVRAPDLFLFDEPLSNLDAPLRAGMRRELRALHQRLGRTFIYVTHDQEEALSLSDRIAVLKNGRIQQCETPRVIYDHPATAFVASFFGSPPINLLSRDVERRGEQVEVVVSGWRWTLDARGARLAPNRIVLGIRPEHVRVAADEADGGMAATVVAVELHGGQLHVHFEAGDVRLTAVERADAPLHPGDHVVIQIDPGRVHLFEPAGGDVLPGVVFPAPRP